MGDSIFIGLFCQNRISRLTSSRSAAQSAAATTPGIEVMAKRLRESQIVLELVIVLAEQD